MEYLATGFAGLDRAADPDVYVRCLRLLGANPGMRAIKDESLALQEAAPGEAVLDVGCGLGQEASALGGQVGPAGLAVGLDASRVMLSRAVAAAVAMSRSAAFVAGDAMSLPFAEGAFAACRIERTLQHLAEPGAALAEMARVVRPGGLVVAVEPDWGTFVVDSDHVAVARQLAAFWCDSFRSGWVGRRLGRLLAQAGLTGIEVVGRSLLLTELAGAEAVYSLFETADRAVAAGAVSHGAAQSFKTEQRRRQASGTFFSSLTFFLARGRKPRSCRLP
jgi:SAM-dependent methyltransferase